MRTALVWVAMLLPGQAALAEEGCWARSVGGHWACEAQAVLSANEVKRELNKLGPVRARAQHPCVRNERRRCRHRALSVREDHLPWFGIDGVARMGPDGNGGRTPIFTPVHSIAELHTLLLQEPIDYVLVDELPVEVLKPACARGNLCVHVDTPPAKGWLQVQAATLTPTGAGIPRWDLTLLPVRPLPKVP